MYAPGEPENGWPRPDNLGSLFELGAATWRAVHRKAHRTILDARVRTGERRNSSMSLLRDLKRQHWCRWSP